MHFLSFLQKRFSHRVRTCQNYPIPVIQNLILYSYNRAVRIAHYRAEVIAIKKTSARA